MGEEGEEAMIPIIPIRIIIMMLIIIPLTALILLGPTACSKIRGLRQQVKIEKAQGGAFENSTVNAVETQAKRNEAEQESEQLTATNEKEIRNAEGADQPVSRAASDAGLRALCRRNAYRNDPRCNVYQAAPK